MKKGSWRIRNEQEERERKEMEEKFWKNDVSAMNEELKCPKCGCCTQFPNKEVKYKCYMCGRVWYV